MENIKNEWDIEVSILSCQKSSRLFFLAHACIRKLGENWNDNLAYESGTYILR